MSVQRCSDRNAASKFLEACLHYVHFCLAFAFLQAEVRRQCGATALHRGCAAEAATLLEDCRSSLAEARISVRCQHQALLAAARGASGNDSGDITEFPQLGNIRPSVLPFSCNALYTYLASLIHCLVK